MMVIVDSSALVSILLGEPEKDALEKAMVNCIPGSLSISAATLVEAKIVMFRKKGIHGVEALENLMDAIGIVTIPFDNGDVRAAIDGFIRFCKSPTYLNFGDCIVYGTARSNGAKLLCKGDDFKRTDLQLVDY